MSFAWAKVKPPRASISIWNLLSAGDMLSVRFKSHESTVTVPVSIPQLLRDVNTDVVMITMAEYNRRLNHGHRMDDSSAGFHVVGGKFLGTPCLQHFSMSR